MLFGLIGAGLGAILLIVGILGLFSARVRTLLRGIPFANKIADPMTWSVILVIVGFLAGGFGVASSYVDLGSIGGASTTAAAFGTVGALDLTIHDGLANSTTTQDSITDDDLEMTFYSTDAAMVDGEEYLWNITIDRELVSEDASITVSCNLPDKEISGITADNIAEKTAGQIDMDINDAGKHTDDNTVYRSFALPEGTKTLEVQVAFDLEEDYHDGMVDYQDYSDIVCTVTGDDGASASVSTRIYSAG